MDDQSNMGWGESGFEVPARPESSGWGDAFDMGIEGLSDAVVTADVSVMEYYEEMGRILAELYPNNTTPIGYYPIDVDPIPSLNIDDVLYGSTDPTQYGGGGSIHSGQLFTVLRKSERFYKNFNTQGVYYSLDIPKPDPKTSPEGWLHDLLDAVITYFKNDSTLEVGPGDRIGMTLSNSITGTEPAYISLRRADQLSGPVVLEHIIRIFDSNKEFFLNGHLTIQFDHIQMPRGSGGARVKRGFGETNADFIQKKTCFLKYSTLKSKYGKDEYCLPYAIVVGRAYLQYKSGGISYKEFKKYQSGFKLLRSTAVNLCLEAGVNMSVLYGGCSLDEVRKFQSILPDYQIVIYMGMDMKRPPYTDSRYLSENRKINIMLHENHYMAMRSVSASFAQQYICPDCHIYSHLRTDHLCKYTCSFCESKPKCNPCPADDMITCVECNRDFLGAVCYTNHLFPQGSDRLSVCNAKKKCLICKVGYKSKDDHFCGIRYCRICEKYETEIHQCHMPLYESKRRCEQNNLYVLYDFETQQDTPLSECEPNKFRHVPNLCVLQTACATCSSNDDVTDTCKDCGVREFIYNSTDCVVNLLDYISVKCNERVTKTIKGKKTKVNKFNKIIAIAHNMSGFDGQFILKYIYESDRFPTPTMIINGTKVIKITLGTRVDFIDSLNYFQASLAKLPQLFGFEGTKGYYAHLFNIPANDNYIGPLPAKHFYCPESMSVEGQQEFNEWYNAHPSDYVFDNKKELIEYCRQDVAILRKACVKFSRDFWECNQIDPFLDACTIAGACNRVFRSKFLQEDSIGVIPASGYRFSDNQSKIALKWLCLVEMDLGIQIQHAGRGPEVIIRDVGRVDGFYQGTVFEFDGCYFHSCTTCYGNQFPKDYASPRADEMRLRREKTIDKHKAIRAAGYSLVVMKECDFRRQLKANPNLDLKLQNHPMLATEPLNPRDAFFGGRTNANNLYFKSDGHTKMHYYDICSLYPFINKTAKCPIGHPKVHVGDDCLTVPWQKLDGLMKVTVLPPRGLDFPVLPSRMHSKLMFVLCDTCGRSLSKCPCDHSDELRQFTGTWVIDEVKLAVSKGYQIVKIHEIWEYKVTQYDPKTRTGGLFSEYINMFLKIKAEASGWPKACETHDQRQAYIKEFYEREGVLLDESKIEYNPSLRQLAKIQLNSFWGRFGMRSDLTRTVLIRCYDEIVKKMFDPTIEVLSIIPINDDNMLLTYKDLEEARIPDKTTNVVIAAFTTAYARMELYKYLDMLGPGRVYYFDTDSIFFIAMEGEVMPEMGYFLGQMTDELEKYGPGAFIIEFVSGGPKNYAYKVYSPSTNETHTVVKVKGITLNYENSQVVNFDLIKNMVIGSENGADKQFDSVKLTNNCIRRTNLGDVYTTRVPKTYRFNYTKRQMKETEDDTVSYGTVPYGF